MEEGNCPYSFDFATFAPFAVRALGRSNDALRPFFLKIKDLCALRTSARRIGERSALVKERPQPSPSGEGERSELVAKSASEEMRFSAGGQLNPQGTKSLSGTATLQRRRARKSLARVRKPRVSVPRKTSPVGGGTILEPSAGGRSPERSRRAAAFRRGRTEVPCLIERQ